MRARERMFFQGLPHSSHSQPPRHACQMVGRLGCLPLPCMVARKKYLGWSASTAPLMRRGRCLLNHLPRPLSRSHACHRRLVHGPSPQSESSSTCSAQLCSWELRGCSGSSLRQDCQLATPRALAVSKAPQVSGWSTPSAHWLDTYSGWRLMQSNIATMSSRQRRRLPTTRTDLRGPRRWD